MKKVIIYFSVLLLFLLVRLSPVYAGLEEGVAAYKRGDYKTAIKELKPVAEQGDSLAQFNLGLMYYNGRGVTKDYTEAFKWYKKAAEQGSAEAQFTLGLRFIEGQSVPRDYVMAYMWNDMVAAQGNVYAIGLRDILENQMTHEQILEAQRLSREFKVKKP